MMSKEAELINKYNELIDAYNKRTVNDDNTRMLGREAYNTLYDLSFYQRDNLDNIENPELLDRTMIKGIDNIFYFYDRINRPYDICPPTYQKFDTNKIMIISDLHYISKQVGKYKYHEDSIIYIDAAIYFAKKNNIKELVILGDLVDGKYKDYSKPGLNQIIYNKSNDDLLNEVSFITSYIRKNLSDVKIRVLLGNHDLNSIDSYKYRYNNIDTDKAFNEYCSVYKDNNIKLDGAGAAIYSFGDNKLLLDHCINKPFGIYNPSVIEYKDEYQYRPQKLYRSISGHAHYYSYRYWYEKYNEISNVICPCLKADYPLYDGVNDIVEYPGFLIVESVEDKINVEPYFINKMSDGNFYIDSLEDLCEFSRTKEGIELPDKYRKYNRNKKVTLNRVIY